MSNVKSFGSGTLPAEMGSRPAPGSMVLLTKLARLVYRRATDAVLGMSLKRYLALTALRTAEHLPTGVL